MQQDIEFLNSEINKLKSIVDSLEGQEGLLNSQVENLDSEISKLKENKELYAKAIEVLDLVQKSTQESIKLNFESVVTHALQFIMGDTYSFELEFGRRGSLPEVNFNIKTADLPDYCDPIDTETGGGLDIVALALRVVFLELFQPKIEGPLILDEPFKMLSSNYLNNAGEFLNALATKIKRQIIIVTHHKDLGDTTQHLIKVGEENG